MSGVPTNMQWSRVQTCGTITAIPGASSESLRETDDWYHGEGKPTRCPATRPLKESFASFYLAHGLEQLGEQSQEDGGETNSDRSNTAGGNGGG